MTSRIEMHPRDRVETKPDRLPEIRRYPPRHRPLWPVLAAVGVALLAATILAFVIGGRETATGEPMWGLEQPELAMIHTRTAAPGGQGIATPLTGTDLAATVSPNEFAAVLRALDAPIWVTPPNELGAIIRQYTPPAYVTPPNELGAIIRALSE